jgi:hypothetical protein
MSSCGARCSSCSCCTADPNRCRGRWTASARRGSPSRARAASAPTACSASWAAAAGRRAPTEKDGVPVAVKLLSAACRPSCAERFRPEAEILGRLDHPGSRACTTSASSWARGAAAVDRDGLRGRFAAARVRGHGQARNRRAARAARHRVRRRAARALRARGASRSQAGQHPRALGWPSGRAGLRRGAPDGRRRAAHRAAHPHRPDGGHAAVHESRAGAGRPRGDHARSTSLSASSRTSCAR